jgi:hypothetical protein
MREIHVFAQEESEEEGVAQMRPERGGSARRVKCLIALGCLLGAATAQWR